MIVVEESEQPEIIVLDRGDYTTCTINLFGGTITSWRIKNLEYLFMTRATDYDELKPFVGGIKFAFPYFGYSEMGPRHGFARNVRWKLIEGPLKLKYGDIQAKLQLRDNAYTRSIWNYKFVIEYTVTLYETKLDITVKVINTSGIVPLRFSLMRHTMLRVPDITKCDIFGLQNTLLSHGDVDEKPVRETGPVIVVKKPILNIYSKLSRNILISNVGKRIFVKLCGDYKNCFIWHPWTSHEQKGLLHDDEHLHMVMIGVGTLEQKVEPHSYYKSEQCIKVIDEDELEQRKRTYDTLNNFPDYFDKYCPSK